MIGRARATAAISFVNALATGIGSAAGVSIPVDAVVELRPARGTPRIEFGPGADTPIARSTLGAALREFGDAAAQDARLTIDSRVPVGRGLKSSSAVGAAIVVAAARAAGRRPDAVTCARLAAEVARTTGQSATGAFDDALAAIGGGVVVTDNPGGRLLRHEAVPAAWGAVLWVPRSAHASSVAWAPRFEARAAEARAAVDLARRGDYLGAMERNTELVEAVVGYDYRGLREELRRQGALASGVSGLGPALAAVGPRDRLSGVHDAMPVGEADRFVVDFTAPRAPGDPA